MEVKMMILLFQILAISTLKPGSAHDQPHAAAQENVAVRGKATQSAIQRAQAPYSHAGNAIDGNRDANFNHGSCSRTERHVNPWWRVDLLETYVISSVTITNVAEGGSARISGAQIHIGDSLENNGIDNPQCSRIDSMASGETETFYCHQPMMGRYVTVHLPKTEFLHLCEVEVNAWAPDHQ